MVIHTVASVLAEDEIPIEDDSQGETVGVEQYTISGYGAHFDVEGLVRRLDRGDIEIPEFQRTFVWNQKKASRFIESLLMGLPVPGIFLYRDRGSQTLRVVDGQQRLLSLQAFYFGVFPSSKREFRLTGLESRFDGFAIKDLPAEDRRRLNDSIIHASIIQQEAPDDGGTSQYSIFERLNTTSTPLSPQEIRSAIYGGPLNDLIQELNKLEAWRSLFGKRSTRKRDEELILRFLALYFHYENYQPPMKLFLNQFMSDNKEMKIYGEPRMRKVFQNTALVILEKLGEKAFKPRRALNAALQDSLMIGVARRLEKGPILAEIVDDYEDLMRKDEFQDLIYSQTSHLGNVRRRVAMTTKAFAQVD